MKAAIYARYSSDKQSETSLDDQVSICQSRAQREGWQVLAIHTDTATSGSIKVSARTGGKALLADMMAGRFDVLLLESLDRLSRDQVEQESIVRRLEHRNIRIICVADGYDSLHQGRKIMRGVRGLINELYLDDLRHKTQRGLHGQIDRGYIAGGKSYGYDIERDDHGSKFVINSMQAHWVRWIFEQTAKGRPFRHIVYDLNLKGIPSPRGSSWAVSAIYGSPVKGSGIVNNSLYIGRYIWNRSQWIKDPDTGKRQRIERPRNEWREANLPELRIIDDLTWHRVRERIDAGRGDDGRKAERRPTSALLSGLLRCPHCSGPMTASSSRRYGCSRSHDRGPTVCQGFGISRSLADRRMIAAVRDQLLSDDAVTAFEFMLAERLAGPGNDTLQAMHARRVELEQQISNLVDAISAMGLSQPLQQRLAAAERELRTLNVSIEISSVPADQMDLRKTFKEMLLNLEEAMKAQPTQARQAMGEILGDVNIQLKDKEVWAQIALGPSLRLAVGAKDYNGGCGGRI